MQEKKIKEKNIGVSKEVMDVVSKILVFIENADKSVNRDGKKAKE